LPASIFHIAFKDLLPYLKAFLFGADSNCFIEGIVLAPFLFVVYLQGALPLAIVATPFQGYFIIVA
jgi:hypothetical protein